MRVCEIKGCDNSTQTRGANLGYEIDGETLQIRICMTHAEAIMVAPRGTWHITADREFKAVPAKTIII